VIHATTGTWAGRCRKPRKLNVRYLKNPPSLVLFKARSFLSFFHPWTKFAPEYAESYYTLSCTLSESSSRRSIRLSCYFGVSNSVSAGESMLNIKAVAVLVTVVTDADLSDQWASKSLCCRRASFSAQLNCGLVAY
jgi:hypothetical protein